MRGASGPERSPQPWRVPARGRTGVEPPAKILHPGQPTMSMYHPPPRMRRWQARRRNPGVTPISRRWFESGSPCPTTAGNGSVAGPLPPVRRSKSPCGSRFFTLNAHQPRQRLLDERAFDETWSRGHA
jgi:hypothetical protein